MSGTRQVDFWKFLTGQGLSALGSSFTSFALSLLVYQLTGSATNLAFSFASGMLPYLLFGLIGGTWADRFERKRLMVYADLLRAGTIASIPLLYFLDALPLWWIYASSFIVTLLRILFEAAEFAAIPNLVSSDNLLEANGRITASSQAASLVGPTLAGLIASVMPVVNVLLFDAFSFIVSALSLLWVRTSFNAGEQRERYGIRADILEGLRYIWDHPVLRSISIMMALVNFVTTVTLVELVLFVKERWGVTNFEYGLLVSGSSIGIIVFSLAAGPLGRRFSFSLLVLGAQTAYGLLIVTFALSPNYWVALPVWGIGAGLAILFNINITSLRQAIVPNHLLGRVVSVARVLAWSATPFGALLGGYLVERTNVLLVYTLAGGLAATIPLVFVFSPLGRAEDFMQRELAPEAEPATT